MEITLKDATQNIALMVIGRRDLTEKDAASAVQKEGMTVSVAAMVTVSKELTEKDAASVAQKEGVTASTADMATDSKEAVITRRARTSRSGRTTQVSMTGTSRASTR